MRGQGRNIAPVLFFALSSLSCEDALTNETTFCLSGILMRFFSFFSFSLAPSLRLLLPSILLLLMFPLTNTHTLPLPTFSVCSSQGSVSNGRHRGRCRRQRRFLSLNPRLGLPPGISPKCSSPSNPLALSPKDLLSYLLLLPLKIMI